MLFMRMREVVICVDAYDINLWISPYWNLGGKFQPHLFGGFPVPVDVKERKMTQ
jgi:hypothetical protein